MIQHRMQYNMITTAQHNSNKQTRVTPTGGEPKIPILL
jgi:hypothetical protein